MHPGPIQAQRKHHCAVRRPALWRAFPLWTALIGALAAAPAHAQEPSDPILEWTFCEAGSSSPGARIALQRDGSLFVIDRGKNRVLKFTSDGQLVTSWGETGSGPGEFRNPVDVAVDNQGYVYVADYKDRRIQKFTTAGTFVLQWSTAPSYVSDIASDEGGHVYVATVGDDDILKYTGDGTLVGRWAIGLPWAVSVDASGQVYAASGSGELAKHTPDGVRLWSVDMQRYDDDIDQDPFVLAVGPSGHVYVSQRSKGRTLVFSSDGQLEESWGGTTGGIAEDAEGNLYVAGACTIRKYAPTAAPLSRYRR